MDLVNETGVPVLSWTGAVRFVGEYCFTVANGDIAVEAVMGANWCREQGYKKVGFFWEKGSSGTDYADFFRTRRGARTASRSSRRSSLGPNPGTWRSTSPPCATRAPRRSCTWATATPRSTSPQRVQGARLGPAALHGHRVHVLSNTNEWAEGLEGWHGVDQLGEDGANPNYEAMLAALRDALRPDVAQRRGGARLRHRAGGDPRHRQRDHRHPQGGQARPREDQVDAVHERRARPPTSPSRRTTTAATRATSSPSASCAAANCTSAATTARSGRRTPPPRCSPGSSRQGGAHRDPGGAAP